jgi:hypothetical protein
MTVRRNQIDPDKMNREAVLPFQLRLDDFALAMQDIYDFFYDVNVRLVERGLERLDDMLRPAIMSGLLSDMLTASLAKHSRTLTANCYFNGHPDLIVRGVYPDNSVKADLKASRSRPPGKLEARWTLTERANNGCAFSSTW